MGKDSCSWPQSFRHIAKALGGAAPHLLRPMYAWANMGHPSREEGFVLCSHDGDADELHHGCYPNLISDPQAAGSVLLIGRYQSVSPSLPKSDDLQTPLSKRYIKGMIVTCLAVAGKKGKVEKGRTLPSSRHPWMRSDLPICASGVRAEGEKCGSPRGLRCG